MFCHDDGVQRFVELMLTTLLPKDASDGENFSGIVAQCINGPTHKATGGFGCYAKLFADLTKAFAFSIMKTKTGLNP